MPRLERWERRTQGALISLAALFAFAYAVPILVPDAGSSLRQGALWVEWGVWGAFAADYGVRLALAERRWQFVRSQPLSLLAVLLPLVQPLRLLRLVSAVLLTGQRIRMAAQVRLTVYVGGAVLGLVVFGSLAVLEVERASPEANIHTFGDALWWSFTTMTTAGYGDLAPTTGLGRLLAVGLMLSGIALLGVVTANIAAWFVSRFDEEDREGHRHRQMLEELLGEVRDLRRQTAEAARACTCGAGAGHRAVPAEPPGTALAASADASAEDRPQR